MLSPDKLAYLSCLPLFQSMDRAALVALLPQLDWRPLTGGETLFRAGDIGDAMYVVLSGRLRVSIEYGNGTEEAIREIARGESVGELALLTGNPRSATVRAIRDSELARLSRAAFENVFKNHPQLVGQLTLQIASRQSQGSDPTLTRRNIRTLAILAFDEAVPIREFTRRLVTTLQNFGATIHLHERSSHLGRWAETDPLAEHGELTGQLSALETNYRFVVYEADAALSPWTQRCIRQADLIWIIAAADSEPEPSRPSILATYFGSRQTSASVELVLLHGSDFQPTIQAQKWLSCLSVTTHHHTVLTAPADFKKLARLLTASAVSLVLSGGGARAFAHIGVIRALSESGIPIDAIGGTSMGAVIAAQHALGWDWQTMVRVNREAWPRCKPERNYTLPLVALNSGKRMDQMLRSMFGDSQIENLRTKFFCVSTNLTRAQAKIHCAGMLWKAVRASISIPGIGPPAIENGEILIDGGLMNNLPVAVMKQFCQGPVLAVDVSEQLEFKSKLAESYTVSGWKLFWQRLNPFSERPDIPNILDILYRTTTVGGIGIIETAKTEADICLNPPVARFGVFDWRSVDAIIEAGYRDAQRQLEQCDSATRRRLHWQTAG